MGYNSEKLYTANEAIESVRQNNFIQILLFAFLRFFIGWCLLFGIVILLFRILNLRAPFIIMFLNGIPLALIYGVDYANKHRASENVCVACVDAYNKAGGLLISEYETGDFSWKFFRKSRYAVPETKLPDEYKQLLGILFIALLFVWGSYYVPLLNTNHFGNRRINISRKVNEIKEQIELLEQENIISSEERAKLDTSLDEIEKNSNNESPGITFEALDQMSEKLRYEASDEMKKRIKDMEVLKKLENFAKEAKKAKGEAKKVQEELDKLKKQLRQAGLNEAQINDLLENYFGNSSASNGINNTNLKNLSQSLNSSIQKKMVDTSELAEKMMEKNLIDEATGEKFKQSMESKNSENAGSNSKENSFFAVDNDSKKNSQNNSEKGNSSKENAGMNGQGSSQNGQNEQKGSKEGKLSGQEGDQSGQEGGQSGQEGGQSGQEGGQSGQEGGQSGQQGGQSGQEGGQSGQEGESSGNGPSNISITTGDGSGGEGGISRGGGYTPMSFGDKASDHNAKYHDETLPSVNPESAVEATSLGIGIADPEVNREKEIYSTGSIKHLDNGENTLNKKNILPKHRNAVKNYFNQQAK